ncbi:hypothetical protein phytr_800 [Candidatus Phycorickettsia trachydisci]|uniref:Uncharacterized protein n=1 Tax=Candidatus Phycorickettsia trachydisci TaxID=2115978 RepID=A0A2P1P6Z3_9RICK|nr:hypothetical protein [Candidatus Phycorickettsia trachydisci]AVP87043.1 hypothetical protein phytr_800 [Candidatus Phycorickettsia trachydisci]
MNNLVSQAQSSLQSFYVSHKNMFDKNLEAGIASYKLVRGMATVVVSAGTSVTKLSELKNNNLSRNLENVRNAYGENIQNYPGWSLYKGFYGMVFGFSTIKALAKPLLLPEEAYKKGTLALKSLNEIPELFRDFCTKTSEAAYATSDMIYLDMKYVYSEMQKAINEQGNSCANAQINKDIDSCNTDLSSHDLHLDTVGQDSVAAAA